MVVGKRSRIKIITVASEDDIDRFYSLPRIHYARGDQGVKEFVRQESGA